MKKNFLLLIIFFILIVGILTWFFVLNYLDPYQNPVLWISFLIISFLLSFSSFLTFIFYFIKKIHYRWETYIWHVISSFRQWFFVSLNFLWLLLFKIISAPLLLSWFLLFLSTLLIELFIQNLKIEN